MIWKVIYLTCRELRWDILILTIAYFLIIYSGIEKKWAVLLMIFMGWLRPIIEKATQIRERLERERQIREQLERERQTQIETAPHKPVEIAPHEREVRQLEVRETPVKRRKPVNWRGIFARALKIAAILVGISLLFVILAFIYLYIYF